VFSSYLFLKCVVLLGTRYERLLQQIVATAIDVERRAFRASQDCSGSRQAENAVLFRVCCSSVLRSTLDLSFTVFFCLLTVTIVGPTCFRFRVISRLGFLLTVSRTPSLPNSTLFPSPRPLLTNPMTISTSLLARYFGYPTLLINASAKIFLDINKAVSYEIQVKQRLVPVSPRSSLHSI